MTQLNKQMNKLGRRGWKRGISGSLITLNESMQLLRGEITIQCLRTTFLFPYLRLVPLSNSFLCCFWQHVVLHTLPRLCRLNDTLLPVSPLLPQGTTTRTGQNEGNGLISFHFSHIKWARERGAYAGPDRAA